MQPGMAKCRTSYDALGHLTVAGFFAKANFARLIPPARFRRRRRGRLQRLSNFQPEFDTMPGARHGTCRAEHPLPMLSGQRAPQCRMTACGNY